MPIYRVTHRHKADRSSFVNTTVADSLQDAIVRREVDLGIDEDEADDYDVYVEPLPDPDGKREARWLELWGDC